MPLFPTVAFNATDPHGRAILHILEHSALAQTLDQENAAIRLRRGEHDDCYLHTHPSLAPWLSDGEMQLVLFIESLNGQAPVMLRYAVDVDEPSKRAMVEALAIAAGVDIGVTA